MPGYLKMHEVAQAWRDFDCAVHVPLTENCGGVLEPLLSAVPVIGGNVGGIPELILDEITGKLVPVRNPAVLAEIILDVLSNLKRYRELAVAGQELARRMFDVRRTAGEVFQIYRHILDRADARHRNLTRKPS